MKLEIGSKVKTITADKITPEMDVVGGMYEFLGKEVTICECMNSVIINEKVIHRYLIHEDGAFWTWYEYLFEKEIAQ